MFTSGVQPVGESLGNSDDRLSGQGCGKSLAMDTIGPMANHAAESLAVSQAGEEVRCKMDRCESSGVHLSTQLFRSLARLYGDGQAGHAS